jgi:hypothetical protein
MRVLCYETFASADIRELIWLNAEWVSAYVIDACRFYIREDRVAFALLLDPSMRHIESEDYII